MTNTVKSRKQKTGLNKRLFRIEDSKNRENWDFYVVKTRIQDCFESSKIKYKTVFYQRVYGNCQKFRNRTYICTCLPLVLEIGLPKFMKFLNCLAKFQILFCYVQSQYTQIQVIVPSCSKSPVLKALLCIFHAILRLQTLLQNMERAYMCTTCQILRNSSVFDF